MEFWGWEIVYVYWYAHGPWICLENDTLRALGFAHMVIEDGMVSSDYTSASRYLLNISLHIFLEFSWLDIYLVVHTGKAF